MEVVDLLGNHRKTGQHFATGASNKLCGQHTLEICYIDCAVTSHGLQIPLSSSVKKIIQSYCIVMVTEDDLQLVPVANSHQVDIVRAFSQGLKYAIKFKKMSDIAFLKGEDSELVLSKVAKAGTDPRPRSILIRLLDESTCKIDTNGCGSSRLLKQIQSAWQSSLVLRSAQLSRLNTTADVTMADEYLSVTINSLKLCSASHTSNIDRGSDQQLEIFNEFANEAWVDLELKERTCRSREFFVFTLIFCIELVQLPSPRASAISDRKAWTVNQSIDDANRCSRSDIRMKQSSSRNLFIDKINGIESNSELQTRLHAIALQRLNLIRAALKVNLILLRSVI